MKIVFLVFVLGFSFVIKSCDNNDEVAEGTSTCIEQEIENQKDVCLTKVVRYTYNDNTVYLFEAGNCCDGLNDLYDDGCNFICSPSGGLDGQGDRKCSDFYELAIEEEVIWTISE